MELQLIVIFIASLICAFLAYWLGFMNGYDKAHSEVRNMIDKEIEKLEQKDV